MGHSVVLGLLSAMVVAIVGLGIMCIYYYDTNQNLGNPVRRGSCPTIALPPIGSSVDFFSLRNGGAASEGFHWRVVSADGNIVVERRCNAVGHEGATYIGSGTTVSSYTVQSEIRATTFTVVDCARDVLFVVTKERTSVGDFTVRDASNAVVGYVSGGIGTSSMVVRNAAGATVMTIDYSSAVAPRKYSVGRFGVGMMANMQLVGALIAQVDFSEEVAGRPYDQCNMLFYYGAWTILACSIVAVGLAIVAVVLCCRRRNSVFKSPA